MARDRTNSGTPRAELPELTGAVKALPPGHGDSALASALTPVVDEIRQLYTEFGVRPYQVFLIHMQWSGNRIGEGSAVEISRREILPTPQVVDMGSTTEVLRQFGLTEEGGLVVDQVSTKYTEDDLMGRTPDLIDPTMPRTGLSTVEFFWEVIESRPSNPASVPRRYVPVGVPMLSRDRFQWRVALAKQDYNRSRGRTFDRRVS
jgi:hypothetical protein